MKPLKLSDKKKKSRTVYIHKWYLFKQFLQLLPPMVASLILKNLNLIPKG